MNKTENDLSYNQTTLDYNAVVQSVEYAFAETRNELNRELSKLYPNPSDDKIKNGREFYNAANHIVRFANHLQTIIETLHTLYGMQERENFSLVNHPLDKE